uniref:Caldesmon-like n=1 Tax=Globodera pallida TaxID=36090 RepID=A0A183C271_GLOPA
MTLTEGRGRVSDGRATNGEEPSGHDGDEQRERPNQKCSLTKEEASDQEGLGNFRTERERRIFERAQKKELRKMDIDQLRGSIAAWERELQTFTSSRGLPFSTLYDGSKECRRKGAEGCGSQGKKDAEAKNAGEKARKDAEVMAKKEVEAKNAGEKARKDAEVKAKKDAEAKNAGEKARKDAEVKAKKEAEAKNAGEKARKDAEVKAKMEVEAKNAGEKARKDAEVKAKKEAEAKEAEAKTRKDAEEKAKNAEEKARKDVEEKAEKKTENRTRKEAEGKPDRGENEKAKCAEKRTRDALAEEYVPAPIIGTRFASNLIRSTELDMAEKPFPDGMRERKHTSTSGGSQRKRGRDYEMSPIRRSAEGAQRGSLEEKVEDARRMILHATEILDEIAEELRGGPVPKKIREEEQGGR